MGTIPIPQGASIGEEQTQGVPIPEGASIGDQSPAPQSTGMLSGATSIAAQPEPKSYIGKIARWVENLSDDIKYGTDETGIGTVLKKMGAHGVYSGNPEAVADFMASLPLGTLKAAKGATEVTPEVLGGPKGKTWEGIKDLVSGGLQAATMPAGIVGPEAGAEAQVFGEGKEGPGLAAQVVKGKKVAQGPAKAALQEASGAQTRSIREFLTGAIDQSEQKAADLYRQMDESGVDVKRLGEKLQNTNRQIRQLTDTPEDQAIEAKLEKARTGIMDKLKDSGVDPKLIQSADAQHKQTKALVDINKVLRNPSIVTGDISHGEPEAINVDQAINAFQKLKDTKYGNRLDQAFGPDGAKQLMDKLFAAKQQGVHAMKVQSVAKWIAGALGTAGAYEAAKSLIH